MFALLDSLITDIYNAVKALFTGVEGAGSSFLKAIYNAGAPKPKTEA